MSDSSVSIKVVNSISELNRDEWDRCAIHHSNDGLDKIEDPFTSYDFLNALSSRAISTELIKIHLLFSVIFSRCSLVLSSFAKSKSEL